MKTEFKFSESQLHTICEPWTGLPNSTQTVTHSYTTIDTLPYDGKNVGDFRSPTAWEYTVDMVRVFTGLRQETFSGRLHNSVVGAYGGDPSVLGSWDQAKLYARALNRLNDKARTTSDWSETLAEASQLRRMGNLLGSAADLAKNLRKNPLSGLSGGYLNFKLGWEPLLSSIYDTAEVLLKYNEQHGLVRIRAGATEPLKSSQFVVNTNSGTSAKVVKQTISGKQGIRFEIVMRGDKAPSLSDFTTLNPVLLGWNLVPYSFVVDWFYDVGGYLENLEAAYLLNSQFVSGYATYLDARFLKEELNQAVVPTNPDLKIVYGKAYRKRTYFKRAPLYAWPLPRKPYLKVDLGSGQLLTAAALLGALLGR